MAREQFSAQSTLRSGVARVDAKLFDFVFPVHSHEHVCIGVMRDGEKSSRYGLHRRTVCKDDVVLVNPGEVHDGRPSGRQGRHYTMLEIDIDAFGRLCRDTIGRELMEFAQPVVRSPVAHGALTRWLASLCGRDVGPEVEAAALFLGLITDSPRHNRRVSNELATRLNCRLRDGAAGHDQLGDLAAELGASLYQLIRAFKQTFGLTPESFRRQLRVERARALLIGDSRLADIAANAGFADQSHMTREFRRLVGLTPAAYRQALC